MSDSADELILKMQHLTAQARATREAQALRSGVERLKGAAQRVAAQAQAEVAELEGALAQAEGQLDQLREGGVQSHEAPAFVAAKQRADEARRFLLRARAKLGFALDQLTEVERREYLAFHAEVRGETHGQLAEDPGTGEGVKGE